MSSVSITQKNCADVLPTVYVSIKDISKKKFAFCVASSTTFTLVAQNAVLCCRKKLNRENRRLFFFVNSVVKNLLQIFYTYISKC